MLKSMTTEKHLNDYKINTEISYEVDSIKGKFNFKFIVKQYKKIAFINSKYKFIYFLNFFGNLYSIINNIL